MHRAVLLRHKHRSQTLGALHIYYRYRLINTFYTLELPWRDNRRNVSCIPDGEYEVEKRLAIESGSLSYNHFWVKDVPNRTWILIHRANYVSSLEGCIAVGMDLTDLNWDSQLDTESSKDALDLLYQIMPEKFVLKIMEA